MTESRTKQPEAQADSSEPGPWSTSSWFLWRLLLLFLYFLSFGPAEKLAAKHIIPDAVLIIYAPIAALYFRCQPAHSFIWLYLRCWGVDIG